MSNLRQSVANLRQFAREMEDLQRSGKLFAIAAASAGKAADLAFRCARATEQLADEIDLKGTRDEPPSDETPRGYVPLSNP